MKTKILLLFTCISIWNIQAQTDTQKRFQSETRKFYAWSKEYDKYELIETEYENSVIDIREIGSKTNGYVVISMVDNGQVRMHHGSIYDFNQDSENEGTWRIKSKYMKAKITYNPKENKITYLYEADDKRYNKLMVFYVTTDTIPNAGLKAPIVSNE